MYNKINYTAVLIVIFLWISISNGEIFKINENKYINDNDNINKFTFKENKLYKYSENKPESRDYPFYTVRRVLENGNKTFADINVYKGCCHDIGWNCNQWVSLGRDIYDFIDDFDDFDKKGCEIAVRDFERNNVTTKNVNKEECEKYPFYTFRVRLNYTYYEDYEYFLDNCHKQKWNCKGGEIVISSDIKEDYIAGNDEKNLCEIAIHNLEITSNATQSFGGHVFIYSQILFLTLFFSFFFSFLK